MRERDALLRRLRRVRRRLRWQGALAGLPIGAAVGALASAGVWMVGGGSGERVAALVAAVVGGLAIGFARTPALARCARCLDEGADAKARNHDRVRIAVELLDQPLTPMTAGAIADATRSTETLATAVAAPWRRPPRAWLAGAAVAVAVATAGWMPRGRPLGERAARASDGHSGRAFARDVARVSRLRQLARRLGDHELEALAAEMTSALAVVGDDAAKEPARTEARRRLDHLRQQARALGEQSEAGAALSEAGRALAAAADPAARAAGEAMARLDGVAAQKALKDLAARAEVMNAEGRAALAAALDRAAEAARQEAGAVDEGRATPEGRHLQRLNRDPEADDGETQERAATSGAEQRPESAKDTRERQLERLERELAESADDCRRDPAACGRRLRRAADDAPLRSDEAKRDETRDELARAGEPQEREAEPNARSTPTAGRSPRGDEHAGDDDQRGRFEKAARGQSPEGGDERTGPGTTPSHAAAPSSPMSAGAQAPQVARVVSPGRGIGTEEGDEGGDPLGRHTEIAAAGRRSHVDVTSGDGPSRAAVIEAGAGGGFAETGYRPVFRAYQAVVEESLGEARVPAERRTLVRKYFELIRPR